MARMLAHDRIRVLGLMSAVGLATLFGCPPPDYRAVDLQVDLLVEPDADPFDTLGSFRVCLTSDGGTDFLLFPHDPGTYLVPDQPDGTYDLVFQSFDLDSERVKDGETPTVVAHAVLTGIELVAGGEPAYATGAFPLCGASCPGDCAAPASLGRGNASIGVRSVLTDTVAASHRSANQLDVPPRVDVEEFAPW